MVPKKKPAPADKADGATTRREQAELATRVLELAPQDPRISQLTAVLDGRIPHQETSPQDQMVRIGEAARLLGRSRRATRELCLRIGITGLRTGAKRIRVQGYLAADIDRLVATLAAVQRAGVHAGRKHARTPTPPSPFADWDDLVWVSDGAREYAETATCPKCGGAIRPLRGTRRADKALYQCTRCAHAQDYVTMMLSVLPEAELYSYKGVPREDSDGFYRCPGCGEVGFHRGEGMCYLCGHEDVCRDDAGHEIAPADMDEYALTGNCPDCNHMEELVAAAD